ncbi:hypothetical protein [Paraburkholderia strydomiana]|uniref:hypothetical protein n=1 Tax=Paraburkholderia strydomiana TaxID=1245417 RepID=UPI0038B8F506
MSGKRTLATRQRNRVFEAYRSRGRANRNLWLVYSIKTDRDWILQSDLHLVHWISFLEVDPNVVTFEIGSDPPDPGVDAVARMKDGSSEKHRITSMIDLPATDELLSTSTIDSKRTQQIRYFQEGDLRPLSLEAMRWLKVVCYGATIRGERQHQATTSVLGTMMTSGAGKIRDVLDYSPNFDIQIIYAVIARAAIKGDISLDLSREGFTTETNWIWRARL